LSQFDEDIRVAFKSALCNHFNPDEPTDAILDYLLVLLETVDEKNLPRTCLLLDLTIDMAFAETHISPLPTTKRYLFNALIEAMEQQTYQARFPQFISKRAKNEKVKYLRNASSLVLESCFGTVFLNKFAIPI